MSIFDELRERINMTENLLALQMSKVVQQVDILADMIGGDGGPIDPPPIGNMTMQKWLQLTTNWTYSWPVNKPNATNSPMNLYLTAGNVPTQFLFERNGAIVSKCPANGVTTENSDYPRAEFRQMINREWDEAEFSVEDFNSLELDFAADISHLTTRGRMCCLQIHGGGDDIAQVIFDRDEGLILSHQDGDAIETIDADYENNDRVKVKLETGNGNLAVVYNDMLEVNIPVDGDSAYFKFGPYLQTGGRSRHVEPADAFGEMTMWDMKLVTSA
jgi:hypothetical protein